MTASQFAFPTCTPGSAWEVARGELFAKPEAKRVMRQMAREAREDYRAGRTTGSIAITENGRYGQ